MRKEIPKISILFIAIELAFSLLAKEKLIVLNEGLWQADNGKITYFEAFTME